MIFLRNYFINTKAQVDVISIIHEINRTIRESTIAEGLVSIFVPGPGAAVTVIEPLPDIIAGLKEAVSIFPGAGAVTKNRRKEDVVLAPRVVAAMLGKNVQIPLSGGKLLLAPHEEVVLIELETKVTRREFFVQVLNDQPAPKQAGRLGAAQAQRR